MYINVTIKMSKQPLKTVVSVLIKDKDITSYQLLLKHRGTQCQFSENICSEDNRELKNPDDDFVDDDRK